MTKYKEIVKKDGFIYIIFEYTDDAWTFVNKNNNWFICCYGGYENAAFISQPTDTEILSWLQEGHCILAIDKGEQPTKFEIDGYQDCPVHNDVRVAISLAMLTK